VISNQRPSSTREFLAAAEDLKSTIGFDDEGICDACRYNDVKNSNIEWDKREEQLVALAQRAKKSQGYDVLVPGSGGIGTPFSSAIPTIRTYWSPRPVCHGE
jgi:hypothetical protein